MEAKEQWCDIFKEPKKKKVIVNLEVCICCCSVAKSCQTVWAPWTVACQAPPSFTMSWSLFKLMFIESVMSSSVTPFSFCPPSYPASWSFPVSQLFASGGQNIGASDSESNEYWISMNPMNIHSWFPLGFIGLVSLLSKVLSRVFSSIAIQKHQLFVA